MFELFRHPSPQPVLRCPVRRIPAQRITQDEEPHLRSFLSAIAERYGRRLTAG